jgi:hypothetical protein
MCGDQGHTKNNLDLRYIHGKIFEYKILLKSIQWEPKFFHADGRTEGHKEADGRFSQICESA